MRRSGCAVLRACGAFAAIFALATSSWAAPVATPDGLIDGVAANGLIVYKGIPFAAPPVANLRWRAPQPAMPWSGVLKADRFSPTCMQKGTYPPGSAAEPLSEDCLYLNVWKPVTETQAKLPVMVWIHGGGLENGSGSNALYAGDVLARRGVIVVTFNYRLGVFGYLADPSLTAESAHHSSGNYGLLDQVAALGWVHENIAAFGGDPDNVTVFGQSSGSIAISALATTPLVRGLFQRAIGESGGLFEPLDLSPDLTLAGAEHQGQEFMQRVGVTSLQALRNTPAAALMKAPFSPGLIIDGYAIRRPPIDVYRSGQQNDVAILVGSNADEGRLFTAGRGITAKNMDHELANDFPGIVVSLIGPKAVATDAEAQAAAATFNTDMRFRWDMWTWARLAAGSGKRKVFLYAFTRVPPYPKGSVYAGLGATHGVEMPYVFGHLEPGSAAWTAVDRRLSDALVTYWTQFAKTGDPNAAGIPAWHPYTLADPRIMYLGNDISAGTVGHEGDLVRIDRLYAIARFVMKYLYVLLAVAALVVTGLAAGKIKSMRTPQTNRALRPVRGV